MPLLYPPSRRFRAGEESLEQVAPVLDQQIGDRFSQVFALANPSSARERLELCEPFAIQPKHHRAQSRLRHPLSLTLTHMVPRRGGTARKSLEQARTNLNSGESFGPEHQPDATSSVRRDRSEESERRQQFELHSESKSRTERASRRDIRPRIQVDEGFDLLLSKIAAVAARDSPGRSAADDAKSLGQK